MKNYKMKKGFTIAEVMVVVVVMGVIAVMTVPNVIKKYQEALERTKIKKSMASYDTAINKMIIENGLKSESLLKEWAESNDCANSVEYFKYVKRDGCIFKTSDGVYWDIGNITSPIIAMSENALQDAKENGTDGKKSFKLVTSYDVLLGTFRVDDLEFEKKRLEDVILQAEETTHEIQAKIDELEKLFGFILNKIDNDENNFPEFLKNCNKTDDTHYNCDGVTYTPKTGDGSCATVNYGPLKGTQQCGTTNKVWVSETPIPNGVYAKGAKKICWDKRYGSCYLSAPDYYAAAMNYCNSKGTHLATLGELKSLGYTDGRFWAAENIDSGGAYMLDSGNVSYDTKYASYDIVCIGN